jgi:hypothetical protein
MVFPVPVVTVQTDNGLEFLGDFDVSSTPFFKNTFYEF